MHQTMLFPDALREFTFAKSYEQIVQLLQDYPELDEYVIPILSLMSTLGLMLEVEKAFGETSETQERVIEIVDPATIEILQQKPTARETAQTINLLISIGRRNPAVFTEEACTMLKILAEGDIPANLKPKFLRYHTALRACLDSGFDLEWALKKKREAEWVDEDWEKADQQSEQMRAFLLAPDVESARAVVHQSRWLEPYLEEGGLSFSGEDLSLRHGLAHALWEKSWCRVRRTVREYAELTTPRAWEVLDQFAETAKKHQKKQTVHEVLAIKFEYFSVLLKKCAEQGVDRVLLEYTNHFVV